MRCLYCNVSSSVMLCAALRARADAAAALNSEHLCVGHHAAVPLCPVAEVILGYAHLARPISSVYQTSVTPLRPTTVPALNPPPTHSLEAPQSFTNPSEDP